MDSCCMSEQAPVEWYLPVKGGEAVPICQTCHTVVDASEVQHG